MPQTCGAVAPATSASETEELQAITLRDVFAMNAPFKQVILPGTDLADLRWMAKKAYEYADSMLAIRAS